MSKQKPRSAFRKVLRWIAWVLLVQFILINISAALYAYKFTHLYSPEQRKIDIAKSTSRNIFIKTWKLFSGPRFYKEPEIATPAFKYTTVALKTKNNLPLEGWYGRVDSASKGTVLLFHNLTGNKAVILEQANEFLSWNYNVMLVDVRAHGNSGGFATTIGYNEAEEVKLAYEYVQQQGEKNIYLWGASLGAVEIIKAVADYDLQPKAMIAEMPFRSLQSHLRGRVRLAGFPEQPFSFLVTFWIGVEHGFNGYGFNSIKYAKEMTCPILLQYEGKDPLVNKKEVEDIYDALPATNKKLVLYEDAAHQFLLQKDPVRWKKEVGDFLTRIR